MGKIHIKGGSDLQVMFTDEDGKSVSVTLKPVTAAEGVPAAEEHWYNVVGENGMIQANKRKKKDPKTGKNLKDPKTGDDVNATPHVFRASGDMEVDFESTQA